MLDYKIFTKNKTQKFKQLSKGTDRTLYEEMLNAKTVTVTVTVHAINTHQNAGCSKMHYAH